MGYSSYSEDIIKRHESDVHDLMRELEKGQFSRTEQAHLLPQFKDIVEKLGGILSDPAHPAALRLLDFRSKASTLEMEKSRLEAKKSELGETNSRLNDKIRIIKKEIESYRKEAAAERQNVAVLKAEMQVRDTQLNKLEAQIMSFRKAVSERDLRIKSLEKLAFEAQVDTKY